MARPLFRQWNKFFNTEFSNLLCENLEKNKAYWDAQIHEEVVVAEEIPPNDDHHDDTISIKSDSSDDLYVTVSDHSFSSHPFDMDNVYHSDDASQSFETEFAHDLNEAFHTAQSQVLDSTDDTAQPCEMESAKDHDDDILAPTEPDDDDAITAQPLLGAGCVTSVAAAIELWENRARQSDISIVVAQLPKGDHIDKELYAYQQAAMYPPADEGPPVSKETSK